MRLEPFQQDVGRDLEKNVGNEEDGERDIGLVAFEMQVFRQAEREGIGDVDAVEEGREVDEEKDGYHAYVYLPEQGFLIDGRWTFGCDSGILCAAD